MAQKSTMAGKQTARKYTTALKNTRPRMSRSARKSTTVLKNTRPRTITTARKSTAMALKSTMHPEYYRTQAKPSIHKIVFSFDVPNVSALDDDGIWSSTVLVGGALWNVNVRKESYRGDEGLAVYLDCLGYSYLPNWSFTVHAQFKLLSFNSEQNALEYVLAPCIYDVENPSFGELSLIEWRDLFDATKQYVKNNTLRLEITLEVANPNDTHKSKLTLENIDLRCEMGASGTFRLTVLNIKNLLAVRSPSIVLQNIRWFFTVFKHLDHLGICLESPDISDESSNEEESSSEEETSYEVKMVVKLIPLKSAIEPIEQMITKEIKESDCAEIEELISWNQLFEPRNSFVNNNSIDIEVKLTVNTADEAASNSRKRTMPGPSNEAKHRKLECAICMEEFKDQGVSTTKCGHLFCSDCIRDEIKRNKECPTCRTSATLRQLKRAHLPL